MTGATILGLLALAAEPSAALAVDAQAAWLGAVRKAAVSTVRVGVTSETNETVTVLVASDSGTVRRTLRVDAGQRHEIELPYRASPGETVQVTASAADGATGSTSIDTRAMPRPGVVALGDVPTMASVEQALGAAVLTVPPAHAPGLVQGYEGIDALILPASSLEALDRDQLSALRGYAVLCRRLVVLGDPGWPRDARCVEVLDASPSPEVLASVVTRLTARPVDQGPALRALDLLSREPRGARGPVILALLGYLALLAIFAGAGRRRLTALAPVAATAVLAILWSRPAVMAETTTWAETAVGSQAIRVTSVLRLGGAGTGQATVTLPWTDLLPQDTQDLAVHAELDAHGRVALPVDMRLLGERTLIARTLSRDPVPLTVAATQAGPVVQNVSGQPQPAGRLLLAGQSYALPSLGPGERWQPADADRVTRESTPLEMLLRQRVGSSTAVFLPGWEPFRAPSRGPNPGGLLILSEHTS